MKNRRGMFLIHLLIVFALGTTACEPPGPPPVYTPSFPLRLSANLNSNVSAIAADDQGNVILAGHVIGNADLNGDRVIDASPPETDVTSHPNSDTYITKFDSTGRSLWMKRLGTANGKVEMWGAAVDNLNNVIVTGIVSNNADLDGDGVISAGIPETPTASFINNSVFISKFDSNGGFLWAKRLAGGSDLSKCYAVDADSTRGILLVGHVYGDCDFNNDGSISAGWPETHLDYTGDVFIIKLDEDGEIIWYKRFAGAGNDYGLAVAVDGSDNVIAGGWVHGNADLNGDGTISIGLPETSTPAFGDDDGFIAKFNSNGVFQWAKRIGGAAPDDCQSLAADAAGNIYAAGDVIGSGDFNGDGIIGAGYPETTGSPFGYRDAYLAKYNATGVLQWVKRLGGSTNDGAKCVTLRANGTIAVCGFSEGTQADLNGDQSISSSLPETSAFFLSDNDCFLAEFDSAGVFQSARRWGGNESDATDSLVENTAGMLFVSGSVHGDADLDGDGVINGVFPEKQLPADGFYDPFLVNF